MKCYIPLQLLPIYIDLYSAINSEIECWWLCESPTDPTSDDNATAGVQYMVPRSPKAYTWMPDIALPIPTPDVVQWDKAQRRLPEGVLVTAKELYVFCMDEQERWKRRSW